MTAYGQLVAGLIAAGLAGLIVVMTAPGQLNRRVEIEGTTLFDYNRRGQIQNQVHLSHVSEITICNYEGLSVDLIVDERRIFIADLEGWRDIVALVIAANPHVKRPERIP